MNWAAAILAVTINAQSAGDLSSCEKMPGEKPTPCELALVEALVYHGKRADSLELRYDQLARRYDLALEELEHVDRTPWWVFVLLGIGGGAAATAVTLKALE